MFDDFDLSEEEKTLQIQDMSSDNSDPSGIKQYLDGPAHDFVEVHPNLPFELEKTAEEVETELKSENSNIYFNFHEFPNPHDADEWEAIEDSITNLQTMLTNQFTEFQNLPYRLYAVFMHRGSVSFGHYWIYLFDFRRNIWRKYNDEYVTEVQNLDEIFYNVSDMNPSTPYFLVYVNDKMIDRLVEPVCREIPQTMPPETTEEAPLYPTDGMDMNLAFDQEATQRGELTAASNLQDVNMTDTTGKLRQDDQYW